ncbi:MAG: hypothetical protein QOE70_4988 [Chthoniobacter sp.]|jgi:hypothetical protein|nr:hypothetical protein [Chthoniobacter sp.]
MLLTLTTKSYEFRQPFDVICLVVFVTLWEMAKPQITGHRLVAFCIVLADALLMFGQPIEPVGALLAPLALIWFSEMLGRMRGMIGHCCLITTETPGWMVAGFGWIVLLIASGFIIHDCLGSNRAVGAISSSLAPITTPAIVHAVPTPITPEPLSRDVTLTTAIEMPVSVRGTHSGSVTLPRGTRVQLVSVGGDLVVVRFLDSSTTVPTTAIAVGELDR